MGIVSKRYAKAVYRFALEKGEAESLYKEMKTLVLSFSTVRSLQKVMNNPTIKAGEKLKVLTTASGIDVTESCRRLLQLLADNKRESYALNIALMYIEYYKKEQGLADCYLTTTQPASDKVKQALESLIKAKGHDKVYFINETRPEIIGGFILKIDDLQLDASVKTQLNRLRTQLIE